MTRKVSQRRYRNEADFRREIERRLRANVPDELWWQIGESVWRDQEIERGYAVEEDVSFALRQLRYRSRTGEMPFSPQQRIKEPQNAQLWQLRSRYLARGAEEDAREWRRRFLPRVLDADAFTLRGEAGSIVKEGRKGTLEPDEFASWIRLLTQEEEGYFVARPLVKDGPLTKVESAAPLLLSFPSSEQPRFLEPDAVPVAWWSGSDTGGSTGIRILAIPSTGSARGLEPNHWGNRILETLADQIRWLGSGYWSLADIAGFFLFGATPLLSPLHAKVSWTSNGTGWGAQMTLRIDPRVRPDEIEAFYRQLRQDRELQMRPLARAKGFSPQVATLLEFVFARWGPGDKPNWSAIWREWQQSHRQKKDGAYESPRVMARVVNRAIAVLEKELWPSY